MSSLPEPHHHHPHEELAGYVDGELSPSALARVQQWLDEDPGMLGEIDKERELAELFRSSRGPDPADADWAAAAERARRKVRARVVSRPWYSRYAGRYSAVAAAAAVLILALIIGPRRDSDSVDFPILEPADVQIISMDPQDQNALIVGQGPQIDNLMVVRPADIQINRMHPAPDGALPRFHIPKDDQTALIAPPQKPTPATDRR